MDSALPVRKAVMNYGLAHAPLIAIIAERFYSKPPADPVWPYVRYGVALSRPFRASCLNGSLLDITLHAFETGETDDACQLLSGVLKDAFDGLGLPLPDAPRPARLNDLEWTQTQVLNDIGRADGWHGVIQFTGTIVS